MESFDGGQHVIVEHGRTATRLSIRQTPHGAGRRHEPHADADAIQRVRGARNRAWCDLASGVVPEARGAACRIVELLGDFSDFGCGTVVALLQEDTHGGVRSLDERKHRTLKRVLLIDQDAATARRMALRCLDKGVAVAIAENVCEAVRTLATTPVALIVADIGRFRLAIPDQAALFDRVAPGVPVLVIVGPGVSLDLRAALEIAGFRVIPSPVEPDDVLKAIED